LFGFIWFERLSWFERVLMGPFFPGDLRFDVAYDRTMHVRCGSIKGATRSLPETTRGFRPLRPSWTAPESG
jgi:hypothetical protein